MAKNEQDSKSTINFGKERMDRIKTYRAKQQLRGIKLTSIEKTVNYIVDKVVPQ